MNKRLRVILFLIQNLLIRLKFHSLNHLLNKNANFVSDFSILNFINYVNLIKEKVSFFYY